MSAGECAGESCRVVALSGRVDAPVCGELEDVLLAEARKGPRRLAVDLSGVDVMDLMAVTVIVWASRVLNFHGGALVLVPPQPAIADLLERWGMAPMAAGAGKRRPGAGSGKADRSGPPAAAGPLRVMTATPWRSRWAGPPASLVGRAWAGHDRLP